MQRAIADGINFVWALLPSAGHCEAVDRAVPNRQSQNTRSGRARPFSSTFALVFCLFCHMVSTHPRLGWN